MAEYLEMNQAPPQGEAASQPPEESEEVKFVLSLYEEGKEARKEYDEKWPEYRDFYKGKHYRTRVISGKADATYNVCRSTIQATIPILTDSRPGFNVGPKEPRDFKFADALSKACEDIWDKRGCDQTLVESLMDSEIVSAGIVKVTWDTELEEGLGDVNMQAVDPSDIFIPKAAVDFTKKCPWTIHRSTQKVGEIRKLFPNVHGIHPDGGQEAEKQKQVQISGEVNLVSPVDQKSRLPVPFTPMPGDEKVVEVLECWLTADSLDEYEEYFEPGSETPAGWKRKYPNGKLITILPQQRVLLQAVENPYKHGKFPFVRIVDTLMARQFWGEGEIEPLLAVQKMINKTLATIMDWMNLHANAPWLIPTNAGIDTDKITNAIAMILPYTPGPNGEKPEKVFPKELPSYVFEILTQLLKMVETISGSQEISQGRRPQGITAAEALSTLQEAAQTRIRLKDRNMQAALTQIAHLMIGLILQYWKTPRIVKVTGTQQWPEFFEFHVKDIQETGQLQFVQQPYQFDEATRNYTPGTPFESDPSKGVFDVKVTSGTALPVQKSERGNLAIKLFELGIIDAEEVLKKVDWDDPEEVLRRMAEQAQLQQQAQMQMAAAMPQKGQNAPRNAPSPA